MMIYCIVAEATKRIHIDMMIMEIFFFSDVVYKSYRADKQKRDEFDPYDMVYHNFPKKHFVLRKVKPCGYCNPKRFPLEGPSFCCTQGKVKLHMPDVIVELR
jgi:sulfur relay (sulfurtransferase) complex TusBCD TusD component (DsrE family)